MQFSKTQLTGWPRQSTRQIKSSGAQQHSMLINKCLPRVRCKARSMLSTAYSEQQTRADAPSWGRVITSAGFAIYAGKHWGKPCTVRLSRLNQIKSCSAQHAQHSVLSAAYQCSAAHLLNEAAVVIDDGSLEQVHPEQP